jgi:hypothetical protein
MFRKMDLILSSGEGRQTPVLLGPLGTANLKHWTTLAKVKVKVKVKVIHITQPYSDLSPTGLLSIFYCIYF